MNTVYLLLGSNEGDRQHWLDLGADTITRKCGSLSVKSAVYETAAWGLEEQPDFLNQVICIRTDMSPVSLLKAVQETETALGRQRVVKWGQRTLDIDILFYESLILSEPELTIPHPHIVSRRFTLTPLAEIAGNLIHPVLHKSMVILLQECEDPLPAVKI